MMQASLSDLEYAAKKKITRRDRFFGEIDASTPWSVLVAEIELFYPKGGRGRPPMGVEHWLRMSIALQCFRWSDEGMKDVIYDSQAIRRFVGIDLTRESAPETTLLKFRRLLKKHQLTERIFTAINTMLAAKGLILRQGTVVDATVIAALTSTKNRSGRKPQRRGSMGGRAAAVNRRSRLTTMGILLDAIEQLKASVRAKVEHVFHIVKKIFGMKKVRDQGLAEDSVQRDSLFGLANLLIAKWRLCARNAQGAICDGQNE